METTSLIFAVGIVVFQIILTVQLLKLKRHYHRLIDVSGRENLTEILDTILDRVTDNQNDLEAVRKKLLELTELERLHLQKIGLVRYNPFEDVGGGQSFVLSLLDSKDTGILITSIHNRNITRWYVKNIINGQSPDHKLTDEEEKAIIIAGKKEK